MQSFSFDNMDVNFTETEGTSFVSAELSISRPLVTSHKIEGREIGNKSEMRLKSNSSSKTSRDRGSAAGEKQIIMRNQRHRRLCEEVIQIEAEGFREYDLSFGIAR